MHLLYNIVWLIMLSRNFVASYRSFRVLAPRVVAVSFNAAHQTRYFGARTDSLRGDTKGRSEAQLRERSEVVECLKTKDIAAARRILSRLDPSQELKNVGTLTSLSTVFHLGEHLPTALEVAERLRALRIPVPEPVIGAIIRCQVDAGSIDEAVDIADESIESMKSTIRMRTLQPLLEKLKKTGDLVRAMKYLTFAAHNATLTGEQLSVLLETVNRYPHPLSESLRKEVDAFVAHCGKKLLGLSIDDMLQLAASVNGVPLDTQLEQGVLADSVPDTVVDSSELQARGYVTNEVAFTGEPVHIMTAALPGLLNTDPRCLIGEKEDHVLQSGTEKLFIRSVADTLRKSTAAAKARLVSIDSRTCRCPNCNAVLAAQPLNNDEKRAIRTALRGMSPSLNNQLNDFKSFLKSYLEFDFVVDAANVAYFGQNSADGKFSFRQIEQVVNKLKAHSSRILVVIPQSYTNPRYPNSIRGGTDFRTPEDKRILESLSKNCAVYKVPSQTDDDWFWLYATVLVNRRSTTPCCVVTGDLMRDHKVAFPDSDVFTRWRLSQVVYLDFLRGSELQQGPEEDEVFLYHPGKFPRLMQRNVLPSSGEVRWHIPAVDRGNWLCVDARTGDKTLADNKPTQRIVVPSHRTFVKSV